MFDDVHVAIRDAVADHEIERMFGTSEGVLPGGVGESVNKTGLIGFRTRGRLALFSGLERWGGGIFGGLVFVGLDSLAAGRNGHTDSYITKSIFVVSV